MFSTNAIYKLDKNFECIIPHIKYMNTSNSSMRRILRQNDVYGENDW